MFASLVRKAGELDVYVCVINGWYDHLHLVVAIPPKHAIAEVVKRLKGASSHELNHSGLLDYVFAWQRGYGMLSLGERQKPVAEAYVRNQKAHHRDGTTNSWLERVSELDEGPTILAATNNDDSGLLREQQAPYVVVPEPPF